MNRKDRFVVAGGAAVMAAACLGLAATMAVAALGGPGSTGGVRNATAKFRTLSVAEQAGYGLLKDKRGIACIAMAGTPSIAMGVHYAKGALVGDGRIQAATPEALVYAPESGGLRLAAVEYVVLKAAWAAPHAGPPVLFGHRFNFTPANNRFGLPAYYSLHAWIWKHNPAGTFAMWNPEVHCP